MHLIPITIGALANLKTFLSLETFMKLALVLKTDFGKFGF